MPIINTVIQGGGSSPTINPLPVTPTTSAQTITAPSGVDGYNPVSVSAVTAAIDSNIQAGNIKSGVSILGVTGSYSGGGVSAGVGLSSSANLGRVFGFTEGDDWENKVGQQIPIVSVYNDSTRFWEAPNYYYAPYTITSGSVSNGVCTITITDANSRTLTIKYLKNSHAVTRYRDTYNDDAIRFYAPFFPKVGDEVYWPVTADIRREKVLDGTTTFRSFTTSTKLLYYNGGTPTWAEGPITVKTVTFDGDGRAVITVQDRNGSEIPEKYFTMIANYEITNNNTTEEIIGYETVTVNVPIPTPTSSGGSFIPLIITGMSVGTGMSMMCLRIFDDGGAGSFYTWEDQSSGNLIYSTDWASPSSFYRDRIVYNNWKLSDLAGDINVIYGGGFKTDMGEIWAVKNLDPMSGDIEYINAQGMTQTLSGYGHSLPQVGDMTMMGMVEEVYDSISPIPVAVEGGMDTWYYSYTDDLAGRMVFENSSGMECYIYGTKFYGMADYNLYDSMGMAYDTINPDVALSYIWMGFEMNNEKYIPTGVTYWGNAAEFRNAQGNLVYVDERYGFQQGTPVYADNQLMTYIGMIDNTLFAQ